MSAPASCFGTRRKQLRMRVFEAYDAVRRGMLSAAAGKDPLHERVVAAYEDARGDVYRYVLTLGLSPGQAQDVTQEVFLRLYTALRDGADIQNPRAWIFRVAHNFGLKLKTKEREHTRVDDGVPEPPSAAPNPEHQVIEKQLNDRIAEALHDLSPQQRQVLHLRAEGLKYREIAEILGIATPTVNEFLRRAVARLKKALNG